MSISTSGWGPIFQLPPYRVGRRFWARDFSAAKAQWPITRHGIDRHWERGTTGEGIRVGIVDTGVDAIHRVRGELQGQVWAAESFVPGTTADGNGHGTHVAGIVAARRDGKGMVGVAPGAQLIIAKALSDNGSGTLRGVVDAINFCGDQGAHIISLSLGTTSDVEALRIVCEAWASVGVFIVAAAGNGAGDGVDFPGAYPETLGVGAIDREDRLAGFSDRGREVDLVAPGVDILSCVTNGDYAEYSGTSMSTPWVSGVLALRLSAELKAWGEIRTKGIGEMRELLDRATKDLGPGGRDPGYGRGIVAADQLLDLGPDDEPDEPDDPGEPGQIAAYWPKHGLTVMLDGENPEFLRVT